MPEPAKPPALPPAEPPAPPLTRIIDLSEGSAGLYATRLLADYGFEVVQIALATGGSGPEANGPDRDSTRAPALPANVDAHLNRNKARLELDLSTGAGREALAREIAGARFVVHTRSEPAARRAGLDPATVRAVSPGASLVTLTPYGYGTAESEWRATDKTLFAHAGAMFGAGRDDREPFSPNVPIVPFLGGIFGAIAILCEMGAARRGDPPAEHIDVALMDVMCGNLEKSFSFYSYLQAIQLRGRGGRYFGGYPAGPFRAKDGFFMLIPGYQPAEYVALLIDRPELLEHPLLKDRFARIRRADEVDALIAPGIAERTLAQLVQAATELRMPCSAIADIDALATDPGLIHRKALLVAGDGSIEIEEPYRFRGRARQGRAADGGPALGEPLPVPSSVPQGAHATTSAAAPASVGQGPLAGVRILDLTQAYAGPTATRVLVELGAEVIKVESIDRLDIVPRGLIPCDNDTSGDFWERSGYFADRNLGKKGITLDLNSPRGRELFLELVDQCDVVSWNFSPRVMEHWGLGAADLLARRPELVVLAMSGFGQTGPDRDRAALAGTMEAAAGFTSMLRYADDELPRGLGLSFGDMASGVYGALAVLLALDHRQRTGRGDVIDLACREAPIPFLAYQLGHWAETGKVPSVQTDLANDGRHVVVRVAGDERFPERWVIAHIPPGGEPRFCDALQIPAPQGERWYEPELADLLQERTQEDVVAALQAAGFAAAPVLDAEQLLLGERYRRRPLFTVLDRAGVGLRPYARAVPVLADGAPIGVELGAPPRLGEHNRVILQGLLGLSDDELQALDDASIIGYQPKGGLPRAWAVPLPLEEMAGAKAVRLVPDALARLGERFGVAIGPSATSAAGSDHTQEAAPHGR